MVVHTRHEMQYCPNCGIKINSATDVLGEGISPSEGDFSICIMCHGVIMFGENLKLCLSSLEEAESLQPGLAGELEESISLLKKYKKGIIS